MTQSVPCQLQITPLPQDLGMETISKVKQTNKQNHFFLLYSTKCVRTLVKCTCCCHAVVFCAFTVLAIMPLSGYE